MADREFSDARIHESSSENGEVICRHYIVPERNFGFFVGESHYSVSVKTRAKEGTACVRLWEYIAATVEVRNKKECL